MAQAVELHALDSAPQPAALDHSIAAATGALLHTVACLRAPDTGLHARWSAAPHTVDIDAVQRRNGNHALSSRCRISATGDSSTI